MGQEIVSRKEVTENEEPALVDDKPNVTEENISKPTFNTNTLTKKNVATTSPKKGSFTKHDKNDFVQNFKKHEKDLKRNKDLKPYEMTFYSINIRGIQSKIGSFQNILIDNKVDIAFVSESHCLRDKSVKIPNYTCYFRNRCIKEKGGVCIYIKNSLANSCTKLESGLDLNEWFIVKIDCFTPSVVLVVYYGIIEQQFPKEVAALQGELFNTIKSYIDEGSTLYWAGDFNNHIGDAFGIKGNGIDQSKGGLNLIKFVNEENLEVLNSRDNTHTHVDKKYGTSSILDLVITNHGHTVKEFKVDGEIKMTPYRLRKVKGGYKRRFSDHVGILWKCELMKANRQTNKVVMWNMNKKFGNDKYLQLTNEAAVEVMSLIESTDDVEIMYEFILSKINEAKDKAYGKITKTKSQLKRQTESQLWKQRTREVEKSIRSLGKTRLTDKVWEMRSIVSEKFADRQFVSVRDPETGKITQDRDETYNVTLKYNVDLMSKESSESGSEESVAMREAKDFVVRAAMEAGTFDEDLQFDRKDYKRVINKIKLHNKNVYNDFLKSGEAFKEAVFMFYQKCYTTERLPASFYETELLKLYKGKGVRVELKSNRFIHLKCWGPKIFEKLIMTKIEDRLFGNPPDFQVGGQKMGSTNEHLLSMITVMRRLEKVNGGGCVIFMDIKSCFDKIKLSDILYESTQCGVMGRPLRVINDYTNNLVIHMQGDPDTNRIGKLSDTTGQGSGFAPVGTSMVMAKTLDNNIKKSSESDQKLIVSSVKGLVLKPNFFVDDLAKPCGKVPEVVANGRVITQTLDELSLTAHPDKSGVLIFGKKKAELTEDVLSQKPTVQKFVLNIKNEETYLGMVFASGGASESITKTLIARKAKCLAKAGEIKTKLADERLMGVGWLASATVIFSSVIVSTLTYGAAAFTGMTVTQWDLLEQIHRQCLIHILDISQKTTYRSLLFVLGLLPAKEILKKLQIGFVNNLLHVKEKGQCRETILKDREIGGIRGLLDEVQDYCEEFGLPNVLETYIPPELLRKQIQRRSLDRLWLDHLSAKKPPSMIRREDCTQRFYSNLPKNKAKLALLMEVGELNFRTNRKYEALKKYGSTNCLVPACLGPDSLAHVNECPGYSSRLKDDAGPYQIIEYLTELENERCRKFNKSLLNHRVI